MLRHAITGLVAIIALAFAGSAHAQKREPVAPVEPPTAVISPELHEQLVTMISGLLDEVQAQVGPEMERAGGTPDRIVAVNQGREYRSQYDLVPGVHYKFFAVCDNECSVLDMELIDLDGTVVGRYARSDDWPILAIRTEYESRFVVRLVLRQCSVQPCYVGLRALRNAQTN